MSTLSRIIVAVDFNDLSAAAARFAATIASRADASMTAVYVDTFEPPAEFTSSQVHILAERLARSKRRALEELESFVARLVPDGVQWDAVVAEGHPVDAILRVAADRSADLIALGTHGRGGLERLMIGSVAEGVIRRAAVPVLTVRSTTRPTVLNEILCPVNDSEIARLAAARAIDLAIATAAHLTLLNIVSAGEPPVDASTFSAGTNVTFERREIGHDDTAVEILAAADERSCDLIVIGAEHERRHDVTPFGSTTAAVTRHARAPVLTVPRQAVRTSDSLEEVATDAV